ncbi:hypothetical protein AWZ03_011105 [Drosophila navojoa]|uniref:Methylated-DNA--protein-cysteine methyltransferase n=1 Tax=Drosophila navojoa TaxID=7232 RepID=A0A484B3U0_DRONA|nr:uncharacterized protein LOC108650090 [Drosophila navojoa]TDG42475.1 hypothetical protein AWZ03_011105 [Drosophila navojoa]
MWILNNLMTSLTPLQEFPEQIKYGFIDSKFGRILLGTTPIQKSGKIIDAICVLYFVQMDDKKSLEQLHRRWPKVKLVADAKAIGEIRNILFEEKENAAVVDIALKGTDLQLAVWAELSKMAAGTTCTYAELADLVDRPKAVRAVASAVAKNEVSILIPCHRVVSKSGAIKYGWGAALKSSLLCYEENI